MFKNYFKIAVRNLWKNKIISSINIIGLAIGMAVCCIIVFYVHDELSYDTYHEKAGRIYRVTTQFSIQGFKGTFARAGTDVAPLLKQTFPEIENAVRFKPVIGAILKNNNYQYNEKGIFMADKEVFSVFSFKSVSANIEHALDQPNSIVLTQELVQKYFGQTDIIGKRIYFNNLPYSITGVLADLPSNTDLKFQALVSWHLSKEEEADWSDFNSFTYLLFRNKKDIAAFESKLLVYDEKEFSSRGKSMGEKDFLIKHALQPLTQLHFSPGLGDDTPKGNRSYLYIFSTIALCVLLIACLNFINLYIAQTVKRQKEVGIRKVSGASKKQLILQFLGEALLMATIAIIIALMLVTLSEPIFYNLTGKSISLANLHWPFTLLIITALLLTGLLAGTYPALLVSSLDPVTILKGKIIITGNLNIKKLLLLSQFVIFIGLIICTIIAYQQIHFMKEENPGFKKHQIMAINIPGDSAVQSKLPLLKMKLMENAKLRVSMSGKPVALDAKASFIKHSNNGKQNLMVNFMSIDENFLNVLEIPLLSGRNFSLSMPTDKTKGVIVNEAMVKWMGWKEPIGQKVYPGEDPSLTVRVIGVTKDFHYTSMHTKIEPLLLYYYPDVSTMLVNISPKDINLVRSVWKNLYPYHPLDYTFLDDAIARQYQSEEKMIVVFTVFTLLAVLIACLGLFGLTSFSVIQRTKEIGIRKVFGASVARIHFLLSRDFIKLVLVAILIAAPISWFVTNKWLQNFSYRIEIQWWMFALAGGFAVLIALFTISFQAIKAALANPAESLRTE